MSDILNILKKYIKNSINSNKRNKIIKIYDTLTAYDINFLDYVYKKHPRQFNELIEVLNVEHPTKMNSTYLDTGFISFREQHFKNFHNTFLKEKFNSILKNTKFTVKPTYESFIDYIKEKLGDKFANTYKVPNDQLLRNYSNIYSKQSTDLTTSNKTISTAENNFIPLLSIITIVLAIVVGIVFKTKEGFCMDDDQYIITVIIITIIIIIYRYV